MCSCVSSRDAQAQETSDQGWCVINNQLLNPEVADHSVGTATCRFCDTPLNHLFVDLGMTPLCESFLRADQINQMEPFYPLHAWVCEKCFLVQVEEYVRANEIFTHEYAYYSSYSESWLKHASDYSNKMVSRFGLGADNHVVEIASNDGYLLRNFVEKKIPCLGVEPCGNVAAVAQDLGIPTVVKFFGVELAKELAADGKQADLLLGNNVLAHVPNLNDFVGGLKILLKPEGRITMEFPHLQRLMESNQFDTIYHEHFCYFSFLAVTEVFKHHGLTMFDVEEIPSHGGSLRIYARHTENESVPVEPSVEGLLNRERSLGFANLSHYTSFDEQVRETKRKVLEFLIDAKRRGKQVVGYGAPGKGNILLNYCGIRTDFLDYTVDRNPHKHGQFLPGTHIPIFGPEKIAETKPDYVMILPWNLTAEISKQLEYIREWDAKFVVPIPEVRIF